MDQLLARETINVGWAVLNLAMFFVFLLRIIKIISVPGFYNDFTNRLTIGFGIYLIGEAGYRFWVAGLLIGIGKDTGFLEGWYPWAFICAAVALLGGLCILRLLTDNNWLWFTIFLMVVAAGGSVSYLGFDR